MLEAVVGIARQPLDLEQQDKQNGDEEILAQMQQAQEELELTQKRLEQRRQSQSADLSMLLAAGASPGDANAPHVSPRPLLNNRQSCANAVISSIAPTSYARVPRLSRRGSSRSPEGQSSQRVLDALAQLLVLRNLDGGILESELRGMDATRLEALLEALKAVQDTFSPVAALTIQRHVRGWQQRTQHHPTRQLETGRRQLGVARRGSAQELELPSACQRCLVFGALNMDLKAEADTVWPKAGTTTVGKFFAQPGGKGANEAVALACLGVRAHLIGRVGDDESD